VYPIQAKVIIFLMFDRLSRTSFVGVYHAGSSVTLRTCNSNVAGYSGGSTRREYQTLFAQPLILQDSAGLTEGLLGRATCACL